MTDLCFCVGFLAFSANLDNSSSLNGEPVRRVARPVYRFLTAPESTLAATGKGRTAIGVTKIDDLVDEVRPELMAWLASVDCFIIPEFSLCFGYINHKKETTD